MRVWLSLLMTVAFAQPVLAQMDMNSRETCLYIGGSFYMCDPQHEWITLRLPEDLEGIGISFDNGIKAQIEVMVSPWVGIQRRGGESITDFEGFIAEELTKVDQFPAATRITHQQRNEQDGILVETWLWLDQQVFSAETFLIDDRYTLEHAAQHAEMLAAVTHSWSFK